MKGINPTIAVTMLVGITIAGAGTLYETTERLQESGKQSHGKIPVSTEDLKVESCYNSEGNGSIVLRNAAEGPLDTEPMELYMGGDEVAFKTDKDTVENEETFTMSADFLFNIQNDLEIKWGGNTKNVDCIGVDLPPAPLNCDEIKETGEADGDGVYRIYIGGDSFPVYCKMTPSGGWTLIASYSDGSFFNDCTDVNMQHGDTCLSACSEFTDDGGHCDESSEKTIQDNEIQRLQKKYIIDQESGELSNFKDSDYVSPAYYKLRFEDVRFTNDQGEYIDYDFSGYETDSMSDFYEKEDNRHLKLRIPASGSNLNPSTINECNDFELAIMDADNDGGPVNYLSSGQKYVKYSAARAGPAWDAGNNGGCHYDDSLGGWFQRKLGGQHNQESNYIAWWVK